MTFVCALCPASYKDLKNLLEHALEHEAQAGLAALVTRNHQCQGCGTRFPFAWEIRDGYCRECR